jgi:hypothetical protein
VEREDKKDVPKSWSGSPWQWRVIEALYTMAYPLVRYRSSDAGRHGRFLGHAFVHAVYVRDGLPWSLKWPITKAEAEQRDLPELMRYVSKVIENWPLKEAREFFRGFSRALQCEPFDPVKGTAIDGERFRIYIILLHDPKTVESLGSVSRLCEYILDRMPEQKAKRIRTNPTLKAAFKDRVEQICRRVKLKLRPRGRPRKIPTAPAA